MKAEALSIGKWFKDAGTAVGLFLLVWLVVMVIILTFLASFFVGLIGFGRGFMGYALFLALASGLLTIIPTLFLAITGGEVEGGSTVAFLGGGFVGGAAVSILFLPFGLAQRIAAEFGREILPFMTPSWVATLILIVAFAFALGAVMWVQVDERNHRREQLKALKVRQV